MALLLYLGVGSYFRPNFFQFHTSCIWSCGSLLLNLQTAAASVNEPLRKSRFPPKSFFHYIDTSVDSSLSPLWAEFSSTVLVGVNQ